VRALRIRRTFVWDPGDGSDIVEGQSGTDTLLFNGAAGAEIFAASSNGGRLLFTRRHRRHEREPEPGRERRGRRRGRRGHPERHRRRRRDGAVGQRRIRACGPARLQRPEPANDDLTVNTSAGDDIVSASGLANSSIALTLNGGDGNDIRVGSQGNDVINGGNNDDILVGGLGTDTAVGGAGTDVDGGGNETFIQ
jgi:Ca2+-binding RTX toxin-like protein